MNPIRILLVEDNPGDVRLLREALRELNGGQSLLKAVGSLSDALRCVSEESFDVVLLDLTLPDSDGYQTLARMRARTEDLPIVVLTGHDDEEFAAEALRLGAQDYLIKGRSNGSLVLRSARYAIERARTFAELRQSMEKYRLLAENITDVIWTTDLTFRRTFTSPSVFRLRGYTSEEVAEQTLDQIFTEESLRLIRQIAAEELAIEQAGAGGLDRVRTAELEMFRRDGSTVWTEVNVSILRDAHSKPTGILGVTRDISARRRTEEALRTKSSQIENLFDNLDYVFMSLDPQARRVLQVSPAFEEVYGLPREALFRNVDVALEVVHPDDREMIDRGVEMLYGGRPFAGEFRIVRPDGEVRWAETHVKPAIDKKGQVIRLDAVVADVTPRKQVERIQAVLFQILNASSTTDNLEEFLSAVRGQLSTLLDATNFYVALYDPAKKMYSFPFFADTHDDFGKHKCELPNSLTDYVRRTGIPLLTDRTTHDKLEADGEIALMGTPSHVWLGVPLKTAKGVIGVMVVQSYSEQTTYTQRELQLMTMVSGHVAVAIERKAAQDALRDSEEQLRQAQKMEAIGRLAGGVAHDFNNLLTAILGHGELAMYKLHEDDPLRENVGQMVRAADRAASLTRQLLAFSRKQVLQPRVFDLNAIVADMEKMLRRLIGEDVELVIRLGGDVGPVRADPGQIEQVIMNLAINARDAMPKGGRLTVETTEIELDESAAWNHQQVTPGRYVMMAVSDTGTGMDSDLQSHIFEPFFTTKEHGKGTGLGLSTVYGIISQSGGHIWVYSEVGRGTTFKVCLPRVSATVEPTRIPPSPEPLKGSETILLVEDEEGVRDLVERILSHHGYRVITAAFPQQAIRMAKGFQGTIDLLVTDIILPQINGNELAKRVRGLRPEIRVMFMSGYTDDRILGHEIADGRASFLAKPFTAEGLARKVREVLDTACVAA
ncbi:response regulator [bacterium]|nr:response regulator [bacterium]MBU1983313.1 response regulator [bacterium]